MCWSKGQYVCHEKMIIILAEYAEKPCQIGEWVGNNFRTY
jgi:hypothetical protein